MWLQVTILLVIKEGKRHYVIKTGFSDAALRLISFGEVSRLHLQVTNMELVAV
jgi:hypothetical protein